VIGIHVPERYRELKITFRPPDRCQIPLSILGLKFAFEDGIRSLARLYITDSYELMLPPSAFIFEQEGIEIALW
jgi:hypothetical protein